MTSEYLLQKVLQSAQAALEPFRETPTEVPDPSFVLLLPDETYSSSNLYAVQKMLEGTWQFDVFFDSGSLKQSLDGM
jgi:mannosyl-oligosaccharide glucosidase